jgi:hypothetical protein
MPSYSYNMMQDLYVFKDLYREEGKVFGGSTFGNLADFADAVSKALNDDTPRTADEYKAEFISRMKNRVAVGQKLAYHPEEMEALTDAMEYLDSL